jgi:hypothetical protein
MSQGSTFRGRRQFQQEQKFTHCADELCVSTLGTSACFSKRGRPWEEKNRPSQTDRYSHLKAWNEVRINIMFKIKLLKDPITFQISDVQQTTADPESHVVG